ncbi:MAG: tyrosine-type recombinase/integrase [Planctomycetaceae bacterium]|nr:tyrosine-type recombinase/integrase [Planctomycetaceae bacterium]
MQLPQPFFRKYDGWWYVQIRQDGKRRQIKLAQGRENRKLALERYWALMSQEDIALAADHTRLNVASLFDAFLDWSEKHNDRKTYHWYKRFLQDFCKFHRSPEVAALKPYHLTRWIDANGWSQCTTRAAITTVKRAMNWAVEEGYIGGNPFRFVKRPPMPRRTQTITPEIHQRLIEATDTEFALFLTALKETGARPGEVMSVTAADVDPSGQLWILKVHKTAKVTQRPRLIYLTPTMVEITRKLIKKHPEGQLFRSDDGKPWNNNSVRLRMSRLRKRLNLPAGIVAYAYRHSFATNGLVNGVPIATMAELLGHTDTKMISAHYAHLGLHVDYLMQAACTVNLPTN